MVRRCVLMIGLAGWFACGMAAQQAGMGSVSGHVICGDTQRPARFASVMLFSVPSGDEDKIDPKNIKDLGSAMSAMMGKANMAQGQTSLDGSFTVANVMPGDYYIFSTLAGYETPMNILQKAMDDGADLKKPLPDVSVVHVSADRQSNADVTITRGASLSGTVSWDDGSPLSGVHVMVKTAGKEQEVPPQLAMMAGMGSAGATNSVVATTDDLGHFRLAGLAPGSYVIVATETLGSGVAMKNGHIDISGMMHVSPLVVYAPASFHKADAKPVTLNAGEDHGDANITFNLGGTHTVSGHVQAIDDHQPVNAGTVTLTDSSDKEFKRSAGIDSTGSYSVEFAPPGTYSVTVTDAAVKEVSSKPSSGMFGNTHTVRSFEDGKAAVTVADNDVTGQNVELTAKKKATQDPDMNGMFGALLGTPPPPPAPKP
jgi:hypothetical protein